MKATNEDRFGRRATYLRVSVTPRCNLKCAYCVPEGERIYRQGKLLKMKEIAKLVRIFAGAGIEKVRLTGGEPLARKGIERLISDIKKIDGIKLVTLTTNGVLLGGLTDRLKDAGLDGVNISLDTLIPERMKTITGYDVFGKIMAATEKISAGNIFSLKLNVVLARGVNDDEITDFAALAARLPLEVRFIEMMPMPGTGLRAKASHVPGSEAESIIRDKYELFPINGKGETGGPSTIFGISGGAGTIGFITPMSRKFCDACNRLRLTAEGKLRSCLLFDEEIDLRPGLETDEKDSWFLEKFYQAIDCKPESHNCDTGSNISLDGRSMRAIGG